MRTRTSYTHYASVALLLSVFASMAWAQERAGRDIYEASCKNCHHSGLAGAPIKGDQEWVQRVTNKGMDTLVNSVTNGLGAMPSGGGCSNCSQEELINAIQYMLPKNMPM